MYFCMLVALLQSLHCFAVEFIVSEIKREHLSTFISVLRMSLVETVYFSFQFWNNVFSELNEDKKG